MKIQDFLICDDIRQEVGNKFSLMGIYDSDIKIQARAPESLAWPLGINLALFGRFQMESTDPIFDSFEIQVQHNKHEVAKVQANLTSVSRDNPITLNTRMPGFPLPGPGELTFYVKFNQGGSTVIEKEMPRTITVSVEKLD